jgi:hypothetical protein
MTDLPAPLVSADVDLRDYPAMMLDVVRLRDSELATHPDGELFRANVLSWCVAWHQIPAASLPDDDATLARLLGYGRDMRTWKKVRAAGGLRGWVKCSDGRLYHPVVAEKANEAWRTKLLQRWRTECARIKKHQQRNHLPVDVPEFDEWVSRGCPQGQPLLVPGTTDECPLGQPPDVPRENGSNRSEVKGSKPKTLPIQPTSTTETVAGAPPAEPSSSASSPSPEGAEERAETIAARLRKLEASRGKRCTITGKDPRVVRWVQAGIRDPDLREAYELAVTQRDVDRDATPINAGFLDLFVAKLLNPKEGASAVVAAAPKPKPRCCGLDRAVDGPCDAEPVGSVSGRHYCREHQDFVMDASNFRKAAA